MKRFLFVLLCCHAIFAAGQVDSLLRILPGASGSDRLTILRELIADDTSGHFREYNSEALRLARQLKDVAGEADVMHATGEHFFNSGVNDSAVLYYQKGLAIAEKNQLLIQQSECLAGQAIVFETKGQYDRALKLYVQALEIAKRSGNKKEIVRDEENLAFFYTGQRKYEDALKWFFEQLPVERQLNDSFATSACLNNIALVYFYRGDYALALPYYKASLEIEKARKDNREIAKRLLNIGILYKNVGLFDLALENLLQSTRYFEKGKPSLEQGSCYNTIGNIYTELGKADSALHYHLRALKVREKINNKAGIAGSLTGIAEAYKMKGEYDSALTYLNRSLVLKNELGDKVLIASTLDLMGQVYFLEKDFEKAESYYNQSLQVDKEVEDPKGVATTLNDLAALYLAWKKYEPALDKLAEGRAIALRIGAKNVLLKNYELTMHALREKGNDHEAMKFYDAYTALKDSLVGIKSKALAELQMRYETDQKEQQIELLNERDKAKTATLDRQHTLIYSLVIGAFLLTVIVLLLFKAYRSRRAALQQSQVIIAQKQNLLEQKQTMMSELHHRIKNNLQVLSSLLELQQLRLKDETTREALRAVEHRLDAMLLIHQDLYGEKIDGQVNIGQYIARLTDNLLYSYGYPSDRIRIRMEVETIQLDADKALSLGFICNEIISNSFKHAFEKVAHPELTVHLERDEHGIHLSVSDNGPGMPEGVNLEKAGSFGLRLIHLFVKDLRGTINIVTETSGSRFVFFIPVAAA